MNERSGSVLAEGYWCETHEFFEEPGDVQPDMETNCQSCGCEPAVHIDVKVIAS